MPRSRKRRTRTNAPPPGPSIKSVLKSFEGRDFAAVVAQCRRILAGDPRNTDALNILGGACIELGDVDGAIDALGRAISVNPGDAAIEANLGTALATAKRYAEAETHFTAALSRAPGDIDVMANLAFARLEQGHFDRALETFADVLARAPGNPTVLIGAIRAAAAGGDRTLAEAYARAALAADGDSPARQRELTLVLHEHHLFAESLAAADAALAGSPASAGLNIDRGVVLSKLARYDAALACFDAALDIEPDNADGTMWRAMLNLSLGRFAAGWPGYRSRPSLRSLQAPNSLAACGKNYRIAPLPQDLSGSRILVDRDQGLGDELFFLRFAKRLRDRGAHITYRSDKRLEAMLQRAGIADAVASDAGPAGAFDHVVAVCDLPMLTGAGDDDSILPPIAIPPLADRTAELAARLAAFGDGPYLGVTWRGGTVGNSRFLHKEIPATRLAGAVAGAAGTIVVLQRNPAEGEVAAFAEAAGRPVLDLSALNADLEAMLSLCSLLDGYVGVSNTNLYLRECCGRSSHVIVPYPPEFRWMVSGTESPWFPGCRVYRQSPDSGWDDAMTRLAGALGAPAPCRRAAG